MGLLDGKVAIVTGAGRGIGREHALLLAREGAAVMVNDLGGDGRGAGADLTPAQEVAEEIRAAGGAAEVNGANVADWQASEGLIFQTVETFGRLDILVNNAGILRDRMAFNMSEEEWDVVVNVVLKGCFAPARHAAAYWRQENKRTEERVNGVIINTASESGLYGNSGQANYGAAKAGIAALSTVLARDLERIGVRVNTIAPAAATRLLGTVIQHEDKPAGEYDALAPAAVAPLVVWLCSDLAKDVNAQVFAVSGARIQLVRGFHPVTQIDSGETLWTSDRIEELRSDLLGQFDVGIPPFLPPLGFE
ncbi:MAG TPA: SDR family NAD(P)-dependent oxidoreductase [Acidimicrobiales bacterium]|jgi:NAD(P)-dependent dehydrogenase (short-subunit alcohol dehydrogenase family)|nr:SDR family NAD(P)-dependent oxidoreductase [Acidimicrobiales bacterium]